VFNVTPPKTTGVTALTRFGRSGGQARVKANDFLLFNQQLAALVRAGIPILQAISMLRKRAASPRLRAVLGDVESQIRGGAALSHAFASQGNIFPRIYTASILAGERSGEPSLILCFSYSPQAAWLLFSLSMLFPEWRISFRALGMNYRQSLRSWL